MIPVSLYGIDVEMCERFYSELPSLVVDSIEDEHYAKAIFSIQEKASIEHVFISEKWSEREPQIWPEDIMMEIEMILQTINYPDVSLLEHLLTLDNVDTKRVSEWVHFSTNLYPIYCEKACDTLTRMGLDTPYKLDDMASYGLFVSRIVGLKIYAPAKGLPEIGLPRARMLQLGLERFE